MDKIKDIIKRIELDYIEFIGANTKEREKLLPLTESSEIKALIWNLLTAKKWRNQISYSDYSKIIDILIARIGSN